MCYKWLDQAIKRHKYFYIRNLSRSHHSYFIVCIILLSGLSSSRLISGRAVGQRIKKSGCTFGQLLGQVATNVCAMREMGRIHWRSSTIRTFLQCWCFIKSSTSSSVLPCHHFSVEATLPFMKFLSVGVLEGTVMLYYDRNGWRCGFPRSSWLLIGSGDPCFTIHIFVCLFPLLNVSGNAHLQNCVVARSCLHVCVSACTSVCPLVPTPELLKLGLWNLHDMTIYAIYAFASYPLDLFLSQFTSI